jgi:mycothiol synthase
MLQIRQFRHNDFDALCGLMASLGGDSFLPVPLEQRMGRPGYSPQHDLLLAEREGRLVAYLDTFRELSIGRVVLESAVLQGHRHKVAPLLLQRATEHAAAIGADAVHFPVADSDRVARTMLEREGFSQVRRFLHLSLRQKQVAGIPAQPPLRPFVSGEEAVLMRIQNLCFARSWGFKANTEEEIRYRLSLTCCSPEGVFFALADGRVTGYCWTRELKGKGEIWMLGVDPTCRTRGVGRALLLKGIYYLRQRGFEQIDLTVDAGNMGAINLYDSVGFRRFSTILWYERRL